jgi:formylglycine-generating enzyme required for sulfatase activity
MSCHPVDALAVAVGRALRVLAVAVACLSATPARAETMTYEMVTVGDPGNANDNVGFGFGSVAYAYQIGTYEVTIGQYAAFLNAVAKTDPYSLYSPAMGSNGNVKGITRQSSPSGYSYDAWDADRPITYVSWFDAARFANWMTNGQGSGSTETGAYTLNGATSGDAVAVNPGAAFRIPTTNEWYKAAYYSPSKSGVGSPGYYRFATQSDSEPGNGIGGDGNQANWRTSSVKYAVTQSTSYDVNQNYLTNVGAFTNSASFYGTFDQTGNVQEWTDIDGTANSSRARQGGNWQDNYWIPVSSTGIGYSGPSDEHSYSGFRLASPLGLSSSPVPEIDMTGAGMVLALVATALGLLERRPPEGS